MKELWRELAALRKLVEALWAHIGMGLAK